MIDGGFSSSDISYIWEKIKEEVVKVSAKYELPVNIAIVGFGKSGKSTLFNTIFGKDIQEVGAQTDLTKEDKEETRFGTIFTDTRGFGTKLVSVEDIKRILHDQNLIIHCINGMTAISAEDKDLYDFCKESRKNIVVAITKSDVMKEREVEEYRESISYKIDASIDPIFISAETGLNMSLLIERIIELLPDAAKDAFIAKQKVDFKAKQKKSRTVIHLIALAAGGVAISPIPVSDVIVLIPMQSSMIIQIGVIYGYKITLKRAKEILAVAGGGIVLRYAFQILVKFLPGAGSIIGPIIAYSGTVALGEAALTYFQSGMKATQEEIAEIYKNAKEKAKKDFKNRKYKERMKSKEAEIRKLNKKLEKNEINQDEFEKKMKDLVDQ